MQVREREKLLTLHGVMLKSVVECSQQQKMSYAVAVGVYCIASLSNSFSCRTNKEETVKVKNIRAWEQLCVAWFV